MWEYLVKRILLFVPVFLFVSMIVFALSKQVPGDIVLELMENNRGVFSASEVERFKRAYLDIAKREGLDKPSFYIAITTSAYPDTLHKIWRKDHRENLRKLIAAYGNWEHISNYYSSLQQLELQILSLPDSIRKTDAFISTRSATQELYNHAEEPFINTKLKKIRSATDTIIRQHQLSSTALSSVQTLEKAYHQILEYPTTYKHWIPAIHWNGYENQYHIWMSRFLRGDFGVSLRDYRPVKDKIVEALFWTAIINLVSLLLAYLFAVPLGVWSAIKKNTFLDKAISFTLFLLYSLPTFWVATLLIFFFTTREYGMDWFASIGLGNPSSAAPWSEVFWTRTAHLILPIFCTTYGSVAFIARQMRGSMQEVLQQNYIRTARAKGLNETQVIWKHAFRNALFPIITLLGGLLPSLLAGSVILESIFNIPGMGWLMYHAILDQDWTVVYAVFMISTILTMVGILISDFLYQWADARVAYN